MATGPNNTAFTDSDLIAYSEYCNARTTAREAHSRAKASASAKYLLAATTFAVRNTAHAPDLALPSPYMSDFTIASATFTSKMAALTARYISACDERSKAEALLQVSNALIYGAKLEDLTEWERAEATYQEEAAAYEQERVEAVNEVCDAYNTFSVAIEAMPEGIDKRPLKDAYVDFMIDGCTELTMDMIGADSEYNSAIKKAEKAFTKNASTHAAPEPIHQRHPPPPQLTAILVLQGQPSSQFRGLYGDPI